MPVYFVVVVVPHTDSGDRWLSHEPSGTRMVRTAAFWNRIDG
jgi:hypothetical protein